MRRFTSVLVVLILILAATAVRAAPERSVSHGEFCYAEIGDSIGDMLFTISSSTSDPIMPRSWDAQVRLPDGDFQLIANGAFTSRDFVFTGRRLRFSADDYDLTCLTTTTSTRATHRDSTSDKVEFFNGSPTTFDSHSVQTATVDDLDCTLSTPDHRVLEGTGACMKQTTEDRVK